MTITGVVMNPIRAYETSQWDPSAMIVQDIRSRHGIQRALVRPASQVAAREPGQVFTVPPSPVDTKCIPPAPESQHEKWWSPVTMMTVHRVGGARPKQKRAADRPTLRVITHGLQPSDGRTKSLCRPLPPVEGKRYETKYDVQHELGTQLGLVQRELERTKALLERTRAERDWHECMIKHCEAGLKLMLAEEDEAVLVICRWIATHRKLLPALAAVLTLPRRRKDQRVRSGRQITPYTGQRFECPRDNDVGGAQW
ncbi:uncharacterized protein K489DRAFT_404022 [Dissoconium aciculare CBS 342.82]|uniref:Uncharacterized protein n=1 Tax=Dissoconium aciculare CBS 342.82 TaxID=1314786 RepID=A0A6J3LWK0_9PEZI|nr:uncharacterized protein K489DRAFT_404022 [Dissoconium aciculare CBS 342.82]KAF1820028.1 hypothetical protein K489DRAFT_404022 [Dissoconium aciculare CBS 342.82]